VKKEIFFLRGSIDRSHWKIRGRSAQLYAGQEAQQRHNWTDRGRCDIDEHFKRRKEVWLVPDHLG
jgi:hypothetical protein